MELYDNDGLLRGPAFDRYRPEFFFRLSGVAGEEKWAIPLLIWFDVVELVVALILPFGYMANPGGGVPIVLLVDDTSDGGGGGGGGTNAVVVYCFDAVRACMRLDPAGFTLALVAAAVVLVLVVVTLSPLRVPRPSHGVLVETRTPLFWLVVDVMDDVVPINPGILGSVAVLYTDPTSDALL